MSGTCLFTGKALDESTKIEHTIPRSLCGRICSKTVTCSEFNEASSKCDAELRQAFIMVLSELAPVLPKDFNPGAIPVKLDNGWDAVKKDGFVDLKGPIIIDRFSSGKPKEVFLSDDTQRIKKYLKILGIKNSFQQYVSMPGEKVFFSDASIYSNLAVLSILKSILCTIDEILQREKIEQFTRNEATKPILDFIKIYISKELDNKGIAELDKYYLGIQLADRKVFEKSLYFHKYKAKSFEHVIIFSSNTATKTLDAAWDIFSHEVHGVRLATKWNGPKVCGFIANPIFQGETVSYRICFNEENPYFKLQKTFLKGFGCGDNPPPDFCWYPVSLRTLAFYDAVGYVETHADDHLRVSFQESASIADTLSLYDLLVARLERTIKESYGKDLEQELKEIERTYAFWKDKPSTILFEDKNELIVQFIHDYQKAFLSLVKDLYPPSKLINSITTVINKVY